MQKNEVNINPMEIAVTIENKTVNDLISTYYNTEILLMHVTKEIVKQ